MPRRGPVTPREIPPDPVYNSVLVQKLINKVMLDGKKSIAEKIVYGAMEIIREKTKQDPLVVLEKAVQNVTPLLEVRPRRVGGATYQVPIEVPPRRGLSLALRWIVRAARERKGMPMKERLALEILDALNNTGGAIKKRDEMHRMAEANKAFAHYRW
ncbi:30S ribosomal protein S7 [Dictyoglomus thermophilum]|uniref:Small ribosomal subunit protein uS7 n=2 Tax=Dictyoglomus thermophilum TaxID=14 RepID=RS7_DICT6|nr:30S ribosomal protein S7 [Dictyoglomus thermophilum]B5YDT9.1 RecName: Full=Small ribosomal subunit protein uS7; AltName: Full=30S ribosomal protein S7 [Dictyoglomus thermophilum H-6-12]ACI19333.1 ribosomal protein S7 [Dictyoglomus thermophilum H-6-12]MCX7721174.1 30S ribosomal protein S7 [Dictyoglomus thermophilum]TYT22783.1 30S ribosomal protein S7 [Dictyoglomus thermophilum]